MMDEGDEAVEAGITAAAEEISRLRGRGRRWAQWGEKEMLIAHTAALTAVQTWRHKHEVPDANTAA